MTRRPTWVSAAAIGGGLLAATTGGGAAIGAIAGHVSKGMSRSDLKELGEHLDGFHNKVTCLAVANPSKEPNGGDKLTTRAAETFHGPSPTRAAASNTPKKPGLDGAATAKAITA